VEESRSEARELLGQQAEDAWLVLTERVDGQQADRMRQVTHARQEAVRRRQGGEAARGGRGGGRDDDDDTPASALVGAKGGAVVPGAGARARSTAEALAALKALDIITKDATERASRGQGMGDVSRRVEDARVAARAVHAEREASARQRQAAAAARKQLSARGGAFGASLRNAGQVTVIRSSLVKGSGGAGVTAAFGGMSAAEARRIERTRARLEAAVSGVTKAQKQYLRSLEGMRRTADAAKRAREADEAAGMDKAPGHAAQAARDRTMAEAVREREAAEPRVISAGPAAAPRAGAHWAESAEVRALPREPLTVDLGPPAGGLAGGGVASSGGQGWGGEDEEGDEEPLPAFVRSAVRPAAGSSSGKAPARVAGFGPISGILEQTADHSRPCDLALRRGGVRAGSAWEKGSRLRAVASRRRVPRLVLLAAGEAVVEAKEARDGYGSSDDDAPL